MQKSPLNIGKVKNVAPTGLMLGSDGAEKSHEKNRKKKSEKKTASGTVIRFRDLFYNNLARRKAVGNATEEYRYILEVKNISSIKETWKYRRPCFDERGDEKHSMVFRTRKFDFVLGDDDRFKFIVNIKFVMDVCYFLIFCW